MEFIRITSLKPTGRHLFGATVGEAHEMELRKLISSASPKYRDSVVLDFAKIESASASYLKRIMNPFFAEAGTPEAYSPAVSPVAVNVSSTDLKEDLEAYLTSKNRVMVLAEMVKQRLKFSGMLGRLDGAALETFSELQSLKEATAAQLYERHPDRTTNQTAWNNRLQQLVELRVASRRREGRIWIYQPTIN